MTDVLKIAEEISREAHEGQLRKNGQPYIGHVELVVSQLGDQATDKIDDHVVAWLHDVLEDSEFISNDLLERGIPETLVREVELLTKPREMSYSDYIARVKSSELAVRVKKADIIANLFDNPGTKQTRKLAKALVELTK